MDKWLLCFNWSLMRLEDKYLIATRSRVRGLLVSLLIAGLATLAASSVDAGETTGWAAYKSGNYAAAYKAFLQRADAGDANAQHNLAVMYDLGQSVPQDLGQAAKWYRLAAEQGHAVSQNNLGIMLENGRGTEQNPAEAAKWYRKAAEQGQAISHCCSRRVPVCRSTMPRRHSGF